MPSGLGRNIRSRIGWTRMNMSAITAGILSVAIIARCARNPRKGYNLALHIVLICVALVSFNPWCNMWVAISPDFFSLEANPWYYIMGVICTFFAIRGTVQYLKLPEK